MWKQGRLYILILAWIACIQHSVVSADIPCLGGVALLGTQSTIEGDRSSFTGIVWERPTDGRYVVTCNPSCSPVPGYSADTNATHSTLTIDSVGMVDAGTWKVLDAAVVGAASIPVCQLTTAKLPRCNVSSDADPTALQPNTNLTLTVDIREYYCSQEAGFYLTTGNVTEMLMKHNVTGFSDVITSSTFSVTPARLGDVTVSYTCDVNTWDLNCDGVSNLSLELPRCNVSSDADPSALQSNTNLTLTVDIREYYCSQEAGFYLTTGNVTEMLMKHNVTDVSDVITSSTFSVTPARLGDVTVSYACDVSTWDLNCDGVSNLSLDQVVLVKPTCFYCTSHTESSLDIQWVYPGNTLYSLTYVIDYRLNDKDGIDDRTITIPSDKSETIYTTTLTELQEDNLYYFRLVVDGGNLGQSEAVSTTCFTRRSEGSESSDSSMGVGVFIGTGVTLVAMAVCLGVAFAFRRKLAAIYQGTDSAENDSQIKVQVSQSSQGRPSSVYNQIEECMYEVPPPQNLYEQQSPYNPYDDLKPQPVSETYDEMKNVSY